MMEFWSGAVMELSPRGDGVLDVIGFLMISVAVHLRQPALLLFNGSRIRSARCFRSCRSRSIR